MVCDVDQQSSHGGWQPLVSNGSRFIQIRLCQKPHPHRTICDCHPEFCKQLIVRCHGVEFSSEQRQLLFAETPSLGIGQ